MIDRPASYCLCYIAHYNPVNIRYGTKNCHCLKQVMLWLLHQKASPHVLGRQQQDGGGGVGGTGGRRGEEGVLVSHPRPALAGLAVGRSQPGHGRGRHIAAIVGPSHSALSPLKLAVGAADEVEACRWLAKLCDELGRIGGCWRVSC